MKFTNILFPVDFSARSHAAVPHVKAMAERFGAKVTLLHAMETPNAWPDATNGGDYPPLDVSRMLQNTANRLAAFAAAAEFPEATVARIVEEGEPDEIISKVAAERGVNLIMLPTHGHGLFRSALLGSVAAKVLHDSHCAVWTGAHLGENEVPQHTSIGTVMCALDLDEGSLDLLKSTAHLTEAFDAKGYIAHSVPWTAAQPEMSQERPLEESLRERARLQIARLQEKAHTSFGVCLEVGAVSDVVRESVTRHQVDLVVIGRGALAHFAGRLRTHVYGVIRDAGCPVLSFPPREVIL